MGHAPLPPSLEPKHWKSLAHVAGMKLYNENSVNSPTLDLATPNSHLLHSEVMRWIVAGIMNVYQLGQVHNMELEGEGQAFYIRSRPWRPWHHIYALCKVSKGTAHKPKVNPAGKYCIRLFYMGCWRRLTVDDYLPLDSERRPLLPMTMSYTEMWPALLSKALLKVAALSWIEHKEIQDFSVMACLTGWYMQELNLYQVPSRSIWWLCQKLLMSSSENQEDRFTGVKDVSVSAVYESVSWMLEPLLCPSIGTTNTDPEAEYLGSVVLCAVIQTFPTEFLPSIEHPVLITKARINPSNEDRPVTPLWKTFRWKEWAIKQGIVGENSEKYVKYIRMFSALQKCQPDENLGARMPSISVIHLPAVPSEESVRHSHKGKHEDENNVGTSLKRKGTRHSSRRTHEEESIAKISLQEEESKHSEMYDEVLSEFWIEFERIVQGITRFEIFYKTKSFGHNLKVNAITQLLQEKVESASHSSKKFNIKDSFLPTTSQTTSMRKSENLKGGRDDALYFLMDSTANKKLLISLSVLNPNACSLPHLPHNMNGSQNYESKHSRVSLSTNNTKSQPSSPPPAYYILGESYCWRSNQIEEISFSIKTVATTCHLLQIEEGLRVFRLWLNLPETYTIRISSQTPFILGTRDRIQEVLTEESMSWKQYGLKFSNEFNTLTNIKYGSPKHQELLDSMRKSYLPTQIPKPSSKSAAVIRRAIHSKFEKTLMKLLVEMTESSETIAQVVSEWRWLFHKEKFGINIPLETKVGEVLEVIESNILTDPEKDISQIVIMRSVGESEIQLKDHRYSDSVETITTSIGQRPKLISFNQQTGAEFLRRMLGNDPDLLKFYPFRNDDNNHIVFNDYKGVVRNVMGEWIPLIRFVVNVHSNLNPFCGIYLTSSLEEVVIQVINNDNLEQIPRFLGDIEPSYFPSNRHGYTIFAYGSDSGEKQKDHNWKIRIVSVPHQQLPHVCSWNTTRICSPEQPPELVRKDLTGYYMPNKENTIYKCLLTIETSQNLTLRTVMSNNNVEFVLRISAGDEDVINEYFGTGEIIIPVMQLKGKDSGGPSFYLIEAQVLKKTWPLSPEETRTVNILKERVRQELLIFTEEDSKAAASAAVAAVVAAASTASAVAAQTPTRRPSTLTEEQVEQEHSIRRKRRVKAIGELNSQKPDPMSYAPFWSLTLLVDEDKRSTVTLEKDERRAVEMRHIKAQWEVAERGRSQKSFEIRQEFLRENRYSSYLRGFIHEQGAESGEKTRYLLEHLSFSEGDDHEPNLVEVDRNDQRRKVVEEFDSEYEEIKTQFANIRKKQTERRRVMKDHLANVTNESRILMAEAYYRRKMCEEKIIAQFEAEEKLRMQDMRSKSKSVRKVQKKKT